MQPFCNFEINYFNRIMETMDTRNSNSARITRRLPPAAVNVLRRWLRANCRLPYPSDAQKNELVELTGLTKKKITQWFINARRRSPLVKPHSRRRPRREIESLDKEQEQGTHLGGTSTTGQEGTLQFCQCNEPQPYFLFPSPPIYYAQ